MAVDTQKELTNTFMLISNSMKTFALYGFYENICKGLVIRWKLYLRQFSTSPLEVGCVEALDRWISYITGCCILAPHGDSCQSQADTRFFNTSLVLFSFLLFFVLVFPGLWLHSAHTGWGVSGAGNTLWSDGCQWPVLWRDLSYTSRQHI